MKKSILALLAALCFTATSANEHEHDPRELDCLTRNIYYESRGEGRIGMLAVGKVTLNRTQHPRFPNTICGTVYQKNQFSWTKFKMGYINPVYYEKAKSVALEVLSGNHELKDFSALFFHNKSVTPGWNLKFVATIRNHHYYKYHDSKH